MTHGAKNLQGDHTCLAWVVTVDGKGFNEGFAPCCR